MTPRFLSILAAVLVTVSAAFAGRPPATHGGQQHTPPPRAASLLDQIPADVEFVPGTIIVKFTREHEARLGSHQVAIAAVQPLLAGYGVVRITRMFPSHATRLAADGGEIALQRLYRVEFEAAVSPLEVARAFAALPEVEYAEPEIVHELFYTPNDPRYKDQYHHGRIEADTAWDITRGDSSVVIAIVDSGVLWNHEDLYENMWVNAGEDIDHDGRYTTADNDGVDNDGNGYIDDVVGVDLVGNSALNGGSYHDGDPSPTTRGHPHGTHVAGIAAARGDNGKGITGVAMSCRIMAIKCAPDTYSPSITRGYDGIVYAADNGADVINCSWGGGGYLQSQKEMIDYAIAKGAIVVAAAGNAGAERVSTPGAYPNVLCVANTDPNDRANASSTFGPWVDVSAPGTDILSSVIATTSTYQKFTGTSMASPVVAGLAALVKSVFPSYTPEQVFEQIRVTSDTIDHLQYSRFRKKIGRGRVNAFRALTVRSPAVALTDWSYSDAEYGNGDGVPNQGETLVIRMHWKNMLEPTTNAVITLSTGNGGHTVTQGSFTAGAIPTLGEVNNEHEPFVITLADTYAPNAQVDLLYTIEDGEYHDLGGVFFIQQPSYRDHDINDIVMTLTNDGNLGFDDMDGILGSGFSYRDSKSIMFEGAFLLGAVVNQQPLVVDVARSGSDAQNRDFEGEQLYSIVTPGGVAAQQGFGHFTDAAAPLSYRLMTDVTQRSYAFTEEDRRNIIFLRYDIANTSSSIQESLHAGLFFDWDISGNSQADIAMYVDSLQLAVAMDTIGSPRVPVVVGVLPLSSEYAVKYWGINNRDIDDSLTIGIYNGFTKAEKWKALSLGIVKPKSDITDVAHVVASGPVDLPPGDTLVAGFAIIAGSTVREVTDAVPVARDIWTRVLRPITTTGGTTLPSMPVQAEIRSVFPRPFTAGQTLHIETATGRTEAAVIDLYDAGGRFVLRLADTMLRAGRQQQHFALPRLAPGMYYLRLRTAARHHHVMPLPIVR
ncbi:MAG: S8 family serine peptidase [Bacteroidota bacterium]|nr:S8 family serine peptidase [Bacteroidota bacterium]